jgi:hypothetical protein
MAPSEGCAWESYQAAHRLANRLQIHRLDGVGTIEQVGADLYRLSLMIATTLRGGRAAELVTAEELPHDEAA